MGITTEFYVETRKVGKWVLFKCLEEESVLGTGFATETMGKFPVELPSRDENRAPKDLSEEMMKIAYRFYDSEKARKFGVKPQFDLNYYAVAVSEQQIVEALKDAEMSRNLESILEELRKAPEPRRLIITFD
jgi:hypothetical protein